MKKNIKQIIFILIFIMLLFLLVFLTQIFYSPFMNKVILEDYIIDLSENHVTDTFSIDKIVLFSSCNSSSIVNSNNTTTINNLLQYTDIAIFINNLSSNEYTLENTLKSVSIKDFSFNTVPTTGTPKLYYKSLTDFATSNIVDDNLITSDLQFEISSENEIDYNKPILFNNCANPITLSYVNSNIKNDYTISNENNLIAYDGSLLKKCNVLLKDISCSLSFTIFIENNLGEHFKCPVYIDIPLANDDTSIYDGSYTYTYNPNYHFYRYE